MTPPNSNEALTTPLDSSEAPTTPDSRRAAPHEFSTTPHELRLSLDVAPRTRTKSRRRPSDSSEASTTPLDSSEISTAPHGLGLRLGENHELDHDDAQLERSLEDAS